MHAAPDKQISLTDLSRADCENSRGIQSVDELGYVPLSQTGAELLLRYSASATNSLCVKPRKIEALLGFVGGVVGGDRN